MTSARFLGVGLPPRAVPCARCGAELCIDGTAFFDGDTWSPQLFCSQKCLQRRFQPPDEDRPDAGAVDNPPPADDHQAAGDDLW